MRSDMKEYSVYLDDQEMRALECALETLETDSYESAVVRGVVVQLVSNFD